MTMLPLPSFRSRLRTLTFALTVYLLPPACSWHSPDSCPSYLVRLDTSALHSDGGAAALDGGLDGGASGFTFVGEWRIDHVCARYCASDCGVCQLVNETAVKCRRSCA
jgi:hypothetical protein